MKFILVIILLIPTVAWTQTEQDTQNDNPTTFQGSVTGGWAGPCERWWATTAFAYEAMRICRVTSYLVQGLSKAQTSPDNWASARTTANQLFRICWGDFPQSGGVCSTPNAWTTRRGWLAAKEQGALPPPVVITLATSGMLQADDEMAFVLSHEMGHAVDPEPNSNQDNEKRADALGIVFIMRAGYDARSAGRGLQMVKGERGQGVLGNLAGMLSSVGDGADIHGYTGDRIAIMKQEYTRQCTQSHNRPIGCKQGWK